MELSVIIVSYNTSDLLRRCLNKVYKALSFGKIEKETEVIVVDNASLDESVLMLKTHFPKALVIQNSQNVGFAKANNQGIRKSAGDYILLLNSDTEVKEDALISLLEEIKKGEKTGVVGAELINADGSIQFSAGFLPNLGKVFSWMFFIDDIPFLSGIIKPYHMEEKSFYQAIHPVDWVSGACFLFRRDIISRVGLMDENIFMYGEETEWCYRIKKAGFAVFYTPRAQVLHHKGGSGSGGSSGILEEFNAVIYLYKKHKPVWQQVLARLFLMFGALLRLIIFGIIGRYKNRVSLYAKAIWLAG